MNSDKRPSWGLVHVFAKSGIFCSTQEGRYISSYSQHSGKHTEFFANQLELSYRLFIIKFL